MATFNGSFTVPNLTGTTNIKVKYRFSSVTAWTSFNIAPSATTYTVTGVNNTLYDFQLVNLNGNDNPSSAITQSIWFTNPSPLLSPTNVTLGYSFSNLSADVDTYTCSIAQYSSPGNIITTHVLSAGTFPGTVSDTFTGLNPSTEYVLSITPAANQFANQTFTYTFTTNVVAACATPTGAITTLV